MVIASHAVADLIESSRIRVVDGGTIRIDNQGPDVQLMGFVAPGIRSAKCDAEIDLVAKASRRMRNLIHGGELDFLFIRCPCPLDKEGTAYCQRGRRCGILKSHGRNVGDLLIVEKLAIAACNEPHCRKPVAPGVGDECRCQCGRG